MIDAVANAELESNVTVVMMMVAIVIFVTQKSAITGAYRESALHVSLIVLPLL